MTKKIKKKKYLIKDTIGIYEGDDSFFDEITSRNHALTIGVLCYHEVYNTLINDAKNDEDSFIGNMKVTTGLNRTLEELNKRYPFLLDEIKSYSRSNNFKITFC